MLWYIILILLKESTAIPEFSVRLHGGSTPFQGHVEVLVAGEWGAIMDNQWDIRDAMVVCRQLGFPAAKNFTTGSYFESAYQATSTNLQNVACTGTEKSLSECSYENVTAPLGQLHTTNAGVICAAGHSLRLSGGKSPSKGNLQVYLSDPEVWRNVCYDDGRWTAQDSLVVCRQLGYDRAVNTTGVATELSAFVSINSNCSGQEFNLQSCGNYNITSLSESCSSRQLINIECEGSPSTPSSPRATHSDCQSISVRWAPPRNNGGHPVSAYVLRYRPIPSLESTDYSSWQVITYDGTETDITLTRLSPGRIYLLSVAASNQIGTSPFSESTVAITSPPDMSSPEDLNILQTGSRSVTLGWTVPSTCGIHVNHYELTYYSIANEDLQYTERALSFAVISSIVNHTVFLLTPHTSYRVKVRAFGYINISQAPPMQGGATQPYISAYSSPAMFQTQEAPPSAPPASFSAFLRSSVYFTWRPVPSQSTNGIITGYIITCRHKGMVETMNIPSTSLEHNVTVERDSQYNCSIAAATQAGTGPESSPILFFTPPNLNVQPSAPRNVVFAILSEHNSNSRQEIIIQIQWNVNKCRNNYSCIEVLGYVAECEDTSSDDIISKIVWQYNVENNSNGVASANLSARPFTQYQCTVTSMNGYGQRSIASFGSVMTPGIAPALSPTEIYVTDIQPTHVRLHWTYSEDPPPGTLVKFNIKVYHQDPLDPDGIDRRREVLPYEHYVLNIMPITQKKFLKEIDFLLPATDYVVNISAVMKVGGEGPGAIARFTTTRRALTEAPTDLAYSTLDNNQPFLFRFTWKIKQPNAISRSMIHSGFTLTCTVDDVDKSETLFSPGQTIINSSLFTSAVRELYSLAIYMPTNCDSTVKYYACSVMAFNEVGVGPSSDNISTYLPCNIGNGLSNSVLTDPYFSLAMLGILILVCITSVICCLAIFLFCRRRRRNLTDVEKLYSTVGEMYDENYIRMAPSDSNIKRNWSISRNHSFNNQRIAPPLPSNRASTALEGHISGLDGTNMENPYDEIPGGKNKRHGNNPYSEIGFNAGRARDSGVRLSSERTPSRPDSHSTRPRTMTPQYSSRASPNVSSQRTSIVQDDLPPPGSRMNMRRDSPYVIEGGNTHEGNCGGLHSSPSNVTNLSGNDYVEVTANGELRSLNKRGGNSSSSLQQAAIKPKTPTAGGVVLEETDHHYDNLAKLDKTEKSAHQYDNLAAARGEGTETGCRVQGERGGEGSRRKSAGGAASESSDFLEFFDNMEAKKGSLQSIMSDNDPAYVAMEGFQSGSAKDTTEDSQ